MIVLGKVFSLVSGLRIMGLVVLSLSMMLGLSTSVFAASKYAAIVIDGSTGEVLHARHADAPRYPASLTKIMTLYILFERLKKQQLNYRSKFRVNRYAASQPPSKLGLKPGSKISVKDIIGALVTKSANDMAATVAVNISGTEKKFARLMTRKARQLGMTNTVFKNASGLPNRHQRTTARDMARLSIRIMNDFPKYSRFFAKKSYRYKRRSYRNHNGLLFTYKGTEGIKTGYTRASGYNLTTSVKRDNKHLIAVVMGGRTSRSRNAQMARLLSQNLSKAVAINNRLPLTQRMAQIGRPVRSTWKSIVYTASITSSVRKPQSEETEILVKHFVPHGFKNLSGGRGYAIQVGVYDAHHHALKQIKQTLAGASSLLENRPPYILPSSRAGVAVHRARFAGFFSRGGAQTACRHLKKEMDINCIVTMR